VSGDLGPGVTRADHHEGATRLPLGRGKARGRACGSSGQLDLPHDMVAQRQRLADATESERMLGDTGDRKQLADAACR
jgi:hypothetical protein